MLHTPVEHSLLAGKHAVRRLYAGLQATIEQLDTPQVLAAMRVLRGPTTNMDPNVAATRLEMLAMLYVLCQHRADWPYAQDQNPATPEATPVPLVWLKWTGGACPVEPNALVAVKFRGGDIYSCEAADRWVWEHHGTPGDIVEWALQPVQPPHKYGMRWVVWDGGRCTEDNEKLPVEPETRVEIRFRNGVTETDAAERYAWYHDGEWNDVVHWRLAQ